jgi:hypothetical protein
MDYAIHLHIEHNDMNHLVDQAWTLCIDKISLVRYDPSPVNIIENCKRLITAFESGVFPGAILQNGRRHRIQLILPVLENGLELGRLLIQAEARFTGICDYRFEFNPANLGPCGVRQVFEILDFIFIEGSHHLLRNSFVTRIDLALDLHDLSADDVTVRSSRHRIHGIFSNQYGVPCTIYLGKPKSNQTVAYTKSTQGGSSLRIERRINPKLRGHELSSLNDPFRVVQMVHCESLTPLLAGMIPNQFFDSVRVRGLGHVLATLPPAQRRAIKAVLKDPSRSPLPTTGKVWRSWSQVLRKSGFIFLQNDSSDGAPLVPEESARADEGVDDES